MSGTEGDVVEVTEGTPAAAPSGTQMSVDEALQEVLKKALIHNGLARGVREVVKALDKRQAHLCVIAENCEEEAITKLVEALCNEHQINRIKVPDAMKLGEMVGLCKIDKEGQARKVRRCSCAVVKDYGETSTAVDVLLNHFKSR